MDVDGAFVFARCPVPQICRFAATSSGLRWTRLSENLILLPAVARLITVANFIQVREQGELATLALEVGSSLS